MTTRPLSEFDPDWPHGHQTRDGRRARIVCKDGHTMCGEYSQPLVVLVDEQQIRNVGTNSRAHTYCLDGIFDPMGGDAHRRWDLVNAPAPDPVVEGWINVYPDEDANDQGRIIGMVYARKVDADRTAGSDRVACVFVTNRKQEG